MARSVWYPLNYTQADIEADIAGRGAEPGEEYERRSLKYGVNSYIKKHREKYPDCTEDVIIVADAIAYTRWLVADVDYNDALNEISAELDKLMERYDRIMKKYNRPL